MSSHDFLFQRLSVLCSFANLGEASWVIDSQFRQHFAVNLDTSFGQASDESAVGQAILTSCCVDTNDPELTEFSLLGSTVSSSVVESLHNQFVCFSELGVTSASVALSQFQNFLMSCVSGNADFSDCHSLKSSFLAI